MSLPTNLPESEDDGGADHLPGTGLPAVSLPATDGTTVDLSGVGGRVVVYCYPKTGRPDEDVIPDGWESIPGARGCTHEACAAKSTDYQREVRDRLGLPFELLSDAAFAFANALSLPSSGLAGSDC